MLSPSNVVSLNRGTYVSVIVLFRVCAVLTHRKVNHHPRNKQPYSHAASCNAKGRRQRSSHSVHTLIPLLFALQDILRSIICFESSIVHFILLDVLCEVAHFVPVILASLVVQGFRAFGLCLALWSFLNIQM